jgi:DNA-binding GntR family transcriptional regulator
MDPAHQREIVEALEAGDPDRATLVIQRRYDLYIKDRIHLGGERGTRRDEGPPQPPGDCP